MEKPLLMVTIILAAGSSSRMGEPKLFLPVFGGESMLLRAVRAAVALGAPVVVVTGAYPEEVQEHLADVAGLVFAHNPDWRTGMAGSIAKGVATAAAYSPKGYFITLADQPTMGVASLSILADAFYQDSSRIIATYYPERAGVPAIFPSSCGEDLLSGEGQRGARQLIARAGDAVRVIRFDTPPPDIDTPEDYEAFRH